jgi:O-antigen biosynthesis alpha-1,2-rhamnosyltransferase
MRFLIECTYVFDHPNINSGIQRVVRNVINNLNGLQRDEACIPVVFKGGRLFRVIRLKPLGRDGLIAKLRAWVDTHRSRYWYWHAVLHNKKPFIYSRNLRRLLYLLFRLFSIGCVFFFGTLVTVTRLWINYERVEPLDAHDGDVLILLDSSWHSDFFGDVEKLKSKGMTVVGVVYDLIPLTHPHFCDKDLVKVFEAWFDWIVTHADGFMCISKTIAEEVRLFDRARSGGDGKENRWYDHFYLGAELDQVDAGSEISDRVNRVFQPGRPVYLMVSTIEPRKNHAYLLDAFDQLWARGNDVSLCFVGKVGWKCEALIKRIESHPERGGRLFMLNDLSDRELALCYQSSRALVFSSFVEGFGLPLIEALDRGLPVLASDIPVFREVVGRFATFFDLADPISLCRAVEAFESVDDAIHKTRLKSWKWLTWRDSAEQLLDRTKGNIDRVTTSPGGKM